MQTEEMEHPVYVECFTIREAAEALGKSELGFKRWITDGLVPPPVLKDTTRGYKQYSLGELTVMANAIKVHEEEFRYFTTKHTDRIEQVWQLIHGYRATRI